MKERPRQKSAGQTQRAGPGGAAVLLTGSCYVTRVYHESKDILKLEALLEFSAVGVFLKLFL